jgi:hypothetical protein
MRFKCVNFIAHVTVLHMTWNRSGVGAFGKFRPLKGSSGASGRVVGTWQRLNYVSPVALPSSRERHVRLGCCVYDDIGSCEDSGTVNSESVSSCDHLQSDSGSTSTTFMSHPDSSSIAETSADCTTPVDTGIRSLPESSSTSSSSSPSRDPPPGKYAMRGPPHLMSPLGQLSLAMGRR